MKFYESSFEEYIASVEKYNFHPELTAPLTNMIFYGAIGIGKYSQVLHFLKKYSPSELKYEKKITTQTDKPYTYHISDIHYEIDISMLGCNSKQLWHEIFFQIIDIISVKANKTGIIVCKNFHTINNELLEIFYSYMQHTRFFNIQIKFILITEHLSFIPENILNCCNIIAHRRPTLEQYKMVKSFKSSNAASSSLINAVSPQNIINTKELYACSLITHFPKDNFNVICDAILQHITSKSPINFITFRDALYDILIYNLEVGECIWYVLSHFDNLTRNDVSEILCKTYNFLKYYNNNYRPIYHLESIFFYIIIKIRKYEL